MRTKRLIILEIFFWHLTLLANNVFDIENSSVVAPDTGRLFITMENSVSVNGLNLIAKFDPLFILPISVHPRERSLVMSDASGHIFSENKISFVVFDQNATQINAGLGKIFEIEYIATDTLNADTITTQVVFYQGIVADSMLEEIPFDYINGSITIYPNPITDTEKHANIPQDFEVFQNYPNPFNPATTIRFNLPASSLVTLKVFNIRGQQVSVTIDNKYYEAGSYNETFEDNSIASGVYFYQIEAKPIDKSKLIFMKTSKMLYLK